MQAPVTFQKALSFAGDSTAHLRSFSFAIFPSSWGDLGRRDGKCTNVNGQNTISTRWEQLRLPSGDHTEGFSKSLAQPPRFGTSGFCLFLFLLLSKPRWPHFPGCTKENTCVQTWDLACPPRNDLLFCFPSHLPSFPPPSDLGPVLSAYNNNFF